MHVRRYRTSDRSGCLKIFETNVPEYFVDAERAEFAAFLDALPGPYFVLDESGCLLGCGGYAITPETQTADLCWGMVRRDRHGKGLGALLLGERLAHIRSDPDAVAVAMHTSQHTRDFYTRFGFVTDRIIPNGYGPGLDRCDMRLDLA